MDVFLIEPGADRYLGRLLTPGCGATPFLKQHEDFTLWPDAPADDRVVRLYDRESGWVGRAVEM